MKNPTDHLQGRHGFPPDFRNRGIRNKLMRPIFGAPGGYAIADEMMQEEESPTVNVTRKLVVAAARALAMNGRPMRSPGLIAPVAAMTAPGLAGLHPYLLVEPRCLGHH